MVDPIADMLNRIKNAQAVQKETVEVPFSQLKYGIAKILEHTGFVKKADFKGRKIKKLIEIHLKYNNTGVPSIIGVKKVSRPGQRTYARAVDLRGVRSGHGVVIVSTPKGLMTYSEAKKQNVGGEVLCEVW